MPYISHDDSDIEAMLARIGVERIDDLFSPIPRRARHEGPLGLPEPTTEIALERELLSAGAATVDLDRVNSFLGAGAYDHFIPSIVDHLAGRTEFYTSYTPYQPEASQGMLTAIFEYQSMMAALTGMEVSNASLYDGASGVAEAVLMAASIRKRRKKAVISGALHPEYLETVRTYTRNLDIEVVTSPAGDGVTDPAALARDLDADTACLVFQSPNFFGNVEDVHALSAAAKDRGALVAAVVDPLSLGVLAPPGEYGADIAVGEGQPLGAELAYGGPHFGFLTTRSEYVRKVPGRIVGQTVDGEGRRGFVLSFQTREQHIRRAKATSNICTNQGLIALRGSMYLAAMGPGGIRRVGELCLAKSHYAAERIAGVDGFSLAHSAPFFKEFAVDCPRPAREICDELEAEGILPGVPLDRWVPDLPNRLLVAVTEKKTRADIDALVEALARAAGRNA